MQLAGDRRAVAVHIRSAHSASLGCLRTAAPAIARRGCRHCDIWACATRRLLPRAWHERARNVRTGSERRSVDRRRATPGRGLSAVALSQAIRAQHGTPGRPSQCLQYSLAVRISRERMWWLESTVTSVLGAMIAARLIRAFYRIVLKQSPASVFDLDSVRFSWPNFLLWAVAGGIGLGTAKVASNRVAAVGWRMATRTEPPKGDEE